MIQHVANGVAARRRVDRYGHEAGNADADVADNPLSAVLGQERNTITRLEAQRPQAGCEALRIKQRSGARPGLDLAVQRLVQEFAIRRGRGKLRQRLGGSLQFGHRQSPLVLHYYTLR